jgi:hypothetical protein
MLIMHSAPSSLCIIRGHAATLSRGHAVALVPAAPWYPRVRLMPLPGEYTRPQEQRNEEPLNILDLYIPFRSKYLSHKTLGYCWRILFLVLNGCKEGPKKQQLR